MADPRPETKTPNPELDAYYWARYERDAPGGEKRLAAAESALLAALTPPPSAEDAAVPTWQPMSTVPLIEDAPILLLTSYNGVTEARFSPGYWTDHHEGREYSGPVWVCGDDEWQIEIEEISKDPSEWHHGSALGWLPRTALPAAPEAPR